VWLLIVYVGLMLVGDLTAYLLGLFVERMWGAQTSLIVFLALYFVFLWLAWVVAVKVTEPRAEAAPAQH
jgi:hypothetical protein